MSEAVASSLGIVAYLALFFGVGLLFIFVNLLIGRFLRPDDPHEEKQEIYECGEPTIGTSYVQFDLRFYVVALLFIIFDVEVAFFFPWATVFGKVNHMAEPAFAVVQNSAGTPELTDQSAALYKELGVRNPSVPQSVPASLQSQITSRTDRSEAVIRKGSRQIAIISLFDIGVFFAVLMVGFAYVWKRGDLDWVRAVTRAGQHTERAPPSESVTEERVLSA